MDAQEINYTAFKYCEANKSKFVLGMEPVLNSPITTIAYFRFFQNGKYLYLCNDLKWVKFCLEKIHENNSTSLGKQVGKTTEHGYLCYLWPTDTNDYVLSALYEHNIWNGLSLFKKLDDNSVELWGFATTRENINIHNFYLDNLDSLKESTKLCKLQYGDIFSTDDAELAVYKNHKDYTESKDVNTEKNLKKFISETNIKRYPLISDGKEFFLSNRENECVSLLSIGNSVKEVADKIDLSTRSVEKYIENIRKKIGVRQQSSIVKLYRNSTKEWF